MWLTFTPDKVVWTFNTPEGKKVYDGVYHIEPTRSPKEIDLGQPAQPMPENMIRGVYKIEGEILTIRGGVERPKEFSDAATIHLELTRVRPLP